MTTADDYINKVLALMPRATPLRTQIAMELRGHIQERVGVGASLDDVLRQLGDPAALAESYLSAVPLVSAPLGRRAAAKLLDILIVVAVMLALGWFASQFASQAVGPDFVFPIMMITVLIGGSFAFGFYTIISEFQAGQTLGKHLTGLRVVRETGAQISLGQSIVRQLPMFLQVYWVDAMFALFTEKSQRAFELLSKTRVVLDQAPAASHRPSADWPSVNSRRA